MSEAATIVELARAWNAEQDRYLGQETIGDLLKIDRALIETPAKNPEDVVALLEVVIRDFPSWPRKRGARIDVCRQTARNCCGRRSSPRTVC